MALIEAGYEPVVVDSLANSKRSVLERIGLITGMVPEFHQQDIRDEAAIDRLMASGIEAVIHFAGLKAVGESVTNPLAYYENNVAGSTALLKVMEHHRVRSIVFSSSATVYGDPDAVPVTELMPPKRPTNPYGMTKLMIEEILRDVHAANRSWNVGILRYFNPAGAHASGVIGEDPHDIPNNLMPFISQVAAEQLPKLSVFGDDYPTVDGTGVRDYIHVVDLAAGHIAALKRLEVEPGFHIWNLGTGSGTSVLEMVRAFEDSTGVHIPYEIVGRRPGDIAAIWADPNLARAELSWQALLSVVDMCRDSWNWQQYALGLKD